MSLHEDVRALGLRAAAAYAGSPAQPEIDAILARLDQPLRVAIAGKVKAGKSTLLNALIGEELAATDAGECTRVVTWYRDGPSYEVWLHPTHGEPRRARFTRDGGALEVDLAGLTESEVERIEVNWPSSRLRAMTLIDTPGIESTSTMVSQRTIDFLAPDDDRVTEADAVIYLMRHLHGSDVRFLESFHDDAIAQATPVNAVGVLSRSDEIGVCRLDAMDSAQQIALRYAGDDRLRRLCQTIVPVAGLLGQAATTMAEAELQALRTLAAMPTDDRDELLLSSDRFRDDDPALPLTAIERDDLLVRFGLFGVRYAVHLLVSGQVTTGPEVARQLLAVSGIEELRRVLTAEFGARANALKARSMLNAIDSLLATHPGPDSDALAAEVERLSSSAHELVEIRLLNVLRLGRLRLRDTEAEELEQVIGGGDTRARLGLAPEATEEDIRAAASAVLARWQWRAENPLSDQAVKDAARVVIRTCEGMMQT